MEKIVAVILAAGKGTRMGNAEGSDIPKVMFEMVEKPIIHYSVNNIKQSGIDKIVLVVGYKKELIEDYFKDKVDYAEQKEQLGTADAVKTAKELLQGKSEAVLVYYGDMPLFKIETIQRLINAYEQEKPTIALLSVNFNDPVHWAFGRIVRNGNGEVVDSVEQKDCTPDQLKIKECNTCFYIFDADWLWENIEQINNKNAQKEYYLTDLIKLAKEQGKKIIALPVSEESEALGINTQEHLKEAEAILKSRLRIES